MQHLCFFLSNKSNPFIIPHAAHPPKILFPSNLGTTIPSKSVTIKQPLCAFCVKTGSIFLQNRFMYPTYCARCSNFAVYFC